MNLSKADDRANAPQHSRSAALAALSVLAALTRAPGAGAEEASLRDGDGFAGATPGGPGSNFVNAPLNDDEWELRLALGVESDAIDTFFSPVLALNYAISDRLSWLLPWPAFSYRAGEAGSAELIVWGGLEAFGYVLDSDEGWIGFTGAAVTGQIWLAPELSLLAQADAEWDFQTARSADEPSRSDDLTLAASAGFSGRAAELLTLSVAVGFAHDVEVHAARVQYRRDTELTLGAVQGLGYRPLPLVQLHLSETFSLDVYASWHLGLRQGGESRQRYAGGFSWRF